MSTGSPASRDIDPRTGPAAAHDGQWRRRRGGAGGGGDRGRRDRGARDGGGAAPGRRGGARRRRRAGAARRAARHGRRAHHLPQRLVRAPRPRRRAPAHLPLRRHPKIRGDQPRDRGDAGVRLRWAQELQRRGQSEAGGPEGAAGGAGGGAAAGHHPLLLEGRLHRHRGGGRGLAGGRRPAAGRRHGDPSQGPGRVRRRALGGGAVAGHVGAAQLRSVRRARARRVPGRPRHEEGAPAVPLPGPQGRHGAHQRHRRLLVPRQQHHPRREGGRLGPRQDPAGGDGQPGEAPAAGVPRRGAPLRHGEPHLGAAAVPGAVGDPRRRRRRARTGHGGRRRVPPHDTGHGAGRVRRAGGRRRARALAGAGRRARRRRGRVRVGAARARGVARRRRLPLRLGAAGRDQRRRRARVHGQAVPRPPLLQVRLPQARRHHVVQLRRPGGAVRGAGGWQEPLGLR